MKLPLSWLKQYVKIDRPAEEYAAAMIMIGNGVEGVETLGREIDRVVVGKITELAKHGNADSLQICQVDVGKEVIQIVTGATNIAVGDCVPVALDGSSLPGGKKIKAGKLRGEDSRGMLCSGPELGVPNELYPNCGDEGILIFGEEHPLGAPVQPIFGLDDAVVDFEVLANRPDCLSVLGIARESAVALGEGPVQGPEIAVKESGGGDVNERIRVTVEDAELCPRYCARVVKNIKIAPSPPWMRRALFAAGVRPINNIVDITNYVMLELGQPMHAFDLGHVRGEHIIVRRARDGETLRTLDEKDRAMKDTMLVIADEQGATGIAGVMGGEGSEITENTREVLFEAACFLRSSVRQTGRALGLRTESSGRFERGVDVHGVRRALDRAAQLVEMLGAGEVVAGVIDVYPNPPKVKPVTLSTAYIRRLTGVEIPEEDILRILRGLRIETTLKDGRLTCVPPADRQDIEQGADIVEEVLRVHGYDNLPSTLMRGEAAQGRRGAHNEAKRQLVGLLCGMGYSEIKTFSFQSPKTFDWLRLPEDSPLRRCAVLLNPLGEENSIMRTTLLGSMLQTLALNQNRGAQEASLFEIAARFLPTQVPIVDVLPEERGTLCLGQFGPEADFYSIKGALSALLTVYGLVEARATWKRGEAPYLHPGRSAQLLIDRKPVAELGEVHPDVMENYGLTARAVVAEIDLQALTELARRMGDIEALPKYPSVTRDIALVMAEEVPAGEVMALISRKAGRLLEKVELFDIYRGASLGEGVKSAAYSLTLRAPDRTLVEEEINKVCDTVLGACEQTFGAKLR